MILKISYATLSALSTTFMLSWGGLRRRETRVAMGLWHCASDANPYKATIRDDMHGIQSYTKRRPWSASSTHTV